MKNGLQSNTYILRFKILIKLFELKKSNFGDMFYCDCNTPIAWLTRKVIENTPSIIEKAICRVYSNEAKRRLFTLSMAENQFISCTADNLIEQSCFLLDTPCLECVRKAGNKGRYNDDLRNDPRVEHQIYDIGKYILIFSR